MATTLPSTRVIGPGPKVIAGFVLMAAIGILLVTYPVVFFRLYVALLLFALLAYVLIRLTSIELWQILVLTALTGFTVFHYGFSNVAFHAGRIPIILGHALMLGAFGLALLKAPSRFLRTLREPSLICILALMYLAILHLTFNVPRYGLYAIRDSSIFLEGIFVLLGLVWSMDAENTGPLMKWLLFVFLLNTVYGFSFPWGEQLRAWSPISGIFLRVPVFGFYGGTAVMLLAGALFCTLVVQSLMNWPSWLALLLAVVQVLGLAILQARSMYIGLAVTLFLLVLAGEGRKFVKLIVAVGSSLLALQLVTLSGMDLPGRIGPVSTEFLAEHAASLLLRRGTPAIGSIYDRGHWYKEAMKENESNTTTFLVGVGFGKPLINFATPQGVAVRQPHNSHLTVLARLGLLGLVIWIILHALILNAFLRVLRMRRFLDATLAGFALWAFLFYVLMMIETSIQPGLEFSSGAIPFYFFVGFVIGFVRWQLPGYLPSSVPSGH